MSTPDATPPTAIDGEGFRPELVPESVYAEYFRHGRDGSGLSDAEYDELITTIERFRDDPDRPEADREAARELLRGIRGRD